MPTDARPTPKDARPTGPDACPMPHVACAIPQDACVPPSNARTTSRHARTASADARPVAGPQRTTRGAPPCRLRPRYSAVTTRVLSGQQGDMVILPEHRQRFVAVRVHMERWPDWHVLRGVPRYDELLARVALETSARRA